MPSATGGIITTNGNYVIHTFTGSGVINFTSGGLIDVLIVGAGGFAAGYAVGVGYNGGGGAGQVRILSNISVGSQSYNIVVGEGWGNGISSFDSYIATKGLDGYYPCNGGTSGNGYAGGSGGIPNNAGFNAGGGGGAGGPGADATEAQNGAGGIGIFCDYSGSNEEYGKGGDGCGRSIPRVNYGDGGSGTNPSPNGTGSSGIVIIRYNLYPDYILIKNGVDANSDIITLKSGTPVSLNKIQSQLTVDDFNNNGLLSSPITSSMISDLSSPFNILTYSSTSNNLNHSRIFGTKSAKLILAKGDINLSVAQNINSVTLTSSITGNSIIKIIVSVDGGNTWKTFKDGNWNNIIPSITDVNVDGINVTTLNSITQTQWTELTGYPVTKVRFGYLLNQDSSNETCNTDSVSLNIDMVGSWEPQNAQSDYKEIYKSSDGDNITVQLLSSGNFKINY